MDSPSQQVKNGENSEELNSKNVQSEDRVEDEAGKEEEKKEESLQLVEYFKTNGFCKGMKMVFRNVTIEPLVFLSLLGSFIALSSNQFLLYDKACITEQGNDMETCHQILFNKSFINSPEKLKLQGITAKWMMIKTFAGLIPLIFMKLLSGSWSDKHGRKPLIYLISFAGMLHSGLIILNVYYMKANLIWLILSDIPAAFFNFTIIFPLALAYIADITDKKNRSARFLIMEVFMFLGIIAGQLSGGFILEHYGYFAAYAISLATSFLAVLYLAFFVKETKGTRSKNFKESWHKFIDFFNFENLKQSFKVLTVKREGRVRLHIILLMVVAVLQSCFRYGHRGIDGLYTQSMYGWTPSETSVATTIIYLSEMALFSIVGIILMKKLNLSQTTLAMIGFASAAIGYAVTGFSYYVWIFYLGSIIKFLSGLPDVIIQAELSNLVKTDEIGKIMTVKSALSSLAGPESSIAFIAVYNATKYYFLGFAYLLSAALYIFPVGVYTIMYLKPLNIEENDAENEDKGIQMKTIKENGEVKCTKFTQKTDDSATNDLS